MSIPVIIYQNSKTKSIGLSVVHGSRIGHVFYAVMKSDLQAISRLNTFCKYADDTTLVVLEHTDVSIHDEFEHVKVWASVNKLLINPLKTKEISSRGPGHCIFTCRQPLKRLSRCIMLNCLVCCFRMT